MIQAMNWVTLIILSVIFIYTPYLRGLFFDSDMYLIEVILAVLFIVNTLWLLIKHPNKSRSAYLIIFLLPAMHLLSLTVAETPKGALDNLFRWLAYPSMFFMLIWARQSDKSKKVDQALSYVFQVTGIWIAFFALFGRWGWVEFKDIMLAERMTGPFQYANVFAALISAFWLYALIALTKEKLSVWAAVLYSLPLVAYGVGFLHSYSRGAMVVFPFAWLVGLLLLKGKAQFSYILYSLISVGASLLVFQTIILSEQSLSNPGLYQFIVAILAVIVIVQLIRHALQRYAFNNTFFIKFEAQKYARFLLPLLFVALGTLLMLDVQNQGLVYRQLPDRLQNRVSDINLETTSALGRTNVYVDALKISNDAPVLGLGGEGWKVVYPKYQEIPYLNNEVHNGYLEVLLSTGWLGLLVFVFVFGFLFLQVFSRIKNEPDTGQQVITKAALVALSMIFIHAAIDFDFSYGTVWFIVFWLLAIGVPTQPMLRGKLGTIHIPLIGVRAVTAVVSVFVLVFGVYTLRFYLAENTLAKARGEIAIDEAQPILEKVVTLNPYNTDYQLNLANVYATRFKNDSKEEWKAKVIESLQTAEAKEPHNPNVLFGIGNSYLAVNEWEKGLQYLEKAMVQDPFNVQIMESTIRIQSQVAAQFAQMKDTEKATMYAKRAVDDYTYYVSKIEPFKTQDIPDKRSLELANSTYFFIGQSNIILGQYPQAIELLKMMDDPKLAVDSQALVVVVYEATGKSEQASAIAKALIPQHADFAQRVVAYRGIINK